MVVKLVMFKHKCTVLGLFSSNFLVLDYNTSISLNIGNFLAFTETISKGSESFSRWDSGILSSQLSRGWTGRGLLFPCRVPKCWARGHAVQHVQAKER